MAANRRDPKAKARRPQRSKKKTRTKSAGNSVTEATLKVTKTLSPKLAVFLAWPSYTTATMTLSSFDPSPKRGNMRWDQPWSLRLTFEFTREASAEWCCAAVGAFSANRAPNAGARWHWLGGLHPSRPGANTNVSFTEMITIEAASEATTFSSL